MRKIKKYDNEALLVFILLSFLFGVILTAFLMTQEKREFKDDMNYFDDYMVDCRVYLIKDNMITDIEVSHNTLTKWTETMAWFDYIAEFGKYKRDYLHMECEIILEPK